MMVIAGIIIRQKHCTQDFNSFDPKDISSVLQIFRLENK